jgi:hypothetical protein
MTPTACILCRDARRRAGQARSPTLRGKPQRLNARGKRSHEGAHGDSTITTRFVGLKPLVPVPGSAPALLHPSVNWKVPEYVRMLNTPDRQAADDNLTRLWTQREAAAYLHVSPRYLRASSVPKMLLPGTGTKGKPLVRYCPADVSQWAENHRVSRRYE